MQFQADILNIPVLRPVITETTALGAAYLAGLSTGFWNDLEEIRKQWKIDRSFVPGMAPEKAQQQIRKWKDAVTRAKSWIS